MEHWPIHRQGHQKRVQILDYLREHPNACPSDIAKAVNLCIRQVRTHLFTLKQHNRVKSDGCGHFSATEERTYLYEEFMFWGEQSDEREDVYFA